MMDSLQLANAAGPIWFQGPVKCQWFNFIVRSFP